jgi:hypothetical protein
MFKKLLVLSAVSALLFSVSAQNARVQSMGGCNIFDDITRLISNPAYLNDYTDQIQATAISSTSFGPAIGIKSLGGKLNVGLLALPIGGSGSSVLTSPFYGTAMDALDTIPQLGNLSTAFPTIPHLLFGVDLDAVTIGLDFFVELTRYKSDAEALDTFNNVTNETHVKEKISNVGGILSANIDLGNFTVSPLFGIGMPKTNGTVEQKAFNLDTTNEVETESSLFLTFGAELGLDINNFDFIFGGLYTNESFQFKVNTDESYEYKNNFLDFYVGLVAEVLNNLLLVSQYNIGIDNAEIIDTNTAGGTDFKGSFFSHNFRLGLERPIAGVWIFDEVIPRAGFEYMVRGVNFKAVNSGGPASETTVNNENSATQVRLTTGVGISKGIAAIDLGIQIGNWGGVLTGPNVILGTLTLDFGKSGSSSSVGGGYEPAPSPVISEEEPASTEESGTTETETETESGTDFDF